MCTSRAALQLLARWSRVKNHHHPHNVFSQRNVRCVHTSHVTLLPPHLGGGRDFPCATGVLRMDLQGGLFAGTKTLKLDAILKEDHSPHHTPWWVVGSLQGNHVVSAVAAIRQRLPHAAVRVATVGRGGNANSHEHAEFRGNELLLRMLVPAGDIVSVQSLLCRPQSGLDAAQSAICQAAQAAVDTDGSTFGSEEPLGVNGVVCSFHEQHRALPVIWEGGAQPEGVRGAAVLADFVQQGLVTLRASSQSASLPIDGSSITEHVAIDAGTGCTAAALVAQLAATLGGTAAAAPLPHVHVVLVAGSPEGFRGMLQCATRELCGGRHGGLDSVQLHDHTRGGQMQTCRAEPGTLQVHLHRPSSAKSFGSVNSTTAKAAVALARASGVLMDPVYTSKLMHTVQQLQRGHSGAADSLTPGAQRWLVVHGGGAGGLFGHSAALSKAVRALDK